MFRTIAAFLLLFILIGIAAPAVSPAEDSCSTDQKVASDAIPTNDSDDDESDGPCDSPQHHQNCCQTQFFVGPQLVWQGWNAEQKGVFSSYFFSSSYPALDGPFQPPKAQS